MSIFRKIITLFQRIMEVVKRKPNKFKWSNDLSPDQKEGVASYMDDLRSGKIKKLSPYSREEGDVFR